MLPVLSNIGFTVVWDKPTNSSSEKTVLLAEISIVLLLALIYGVVALN